MIMDQNAYFFGNHSGFMYNLVTKTSKSHADFALLIFFYISTDTVD